MPTRILDDKFIEAVGRNKIAFLLIVLLGSNVYQYVQGNATINKYQETNQKLNDKNIELTERALQYERVRSERYEFLLSNLPKPQSLANVK